MKTIVDEASVEQSIAAAMDIIERRRLLGIVMRANRAAAQSTTVEQRSEDAVVLPGINQTKSGATKVYLAALRSDPCAYCGGAGGVLDHIHPLLRRGTKAEARGDRDERQRGADSWTNLTGACYSCNATKGPKTLLAHLGFSRWDRKALLDELMQEAVSWRRLGLGER